MINLFDFSFVFLSSKNSTTIIYGFFFYCFCRRNIYVRPPESGTMRDIFLQPFNNRLFFCVGLMQFFIITTIGTIDYAENNIFNNKYDNKNGIGEATLWCTSIMCMQGKRLF